VHAIPEAEREREGGREGGGREGRCAGTDDRARDFNRKTELARRARALRGKSRGLTRSLGERYYQIYDTVFLNIQRPFAWPVYMVVPRLM
jgi:hypothetical protein